MMARFTNQAERALELATEAAREFQHGYVGTEHILLGLIREGNGIAAKVLEQEGITDEQVTMMIQKLEMEGGHTTDQPDWTPRSKRIISNSAQEAVRMGTVFI